MVSRLRVCLGTLVLILSYSAFAEPPTPKGWLPHSPSSELGDASGRVVTGE